MGFEVVAIQCVCDKYFYFLAPNALSVLSRLDTNGSKFKVKSSKESKDLLLELDGDGSNCKSDENTSGLFRAMQELIQKQLTDESTFSDSTELFISRLKARRANAINQSKQQPFQLSPQQLFDPSEQQPFQLSPQQLFDQSKQQPLNQPQQPLNQSEQQPFQLSPQQLFDQSEQQPFQLSQQRTFVLSRPCGS
jgi:hypothetical protein